MASRTLETQPQLCAHTAGMLYLIVIVLGLFGEAVVRGSLIVPGDAQATADNIRSSEMLFRLGFAADAVMILSDVALAILLYFLLRPVGPVLAVIASAFRLVQSAILGGNLLNHHAALLVLNNADRLTGFNGDQLNALALLFLDAHGHGYDLGLLFFGLSNLLLGFLVLKAVYFPRILGLLLTAGGAVYLLGGFIRFLAPAVVDPFQPLYAIPLAAEVAFCLWLLVRGVNVTKWWQVAMLRGTGP